MLVHFQLPSAGAKATPAQQWKDRQAYLDDLIKSIHESCGLTDRQLRRLQIASKGAVEYSFAADRVTEDKLRVKAVIPHHRLGRVRALDAPSNLANHVGAVADQPIWTKTLERTLTNEQLAIAKHLEKQQRPNWHRNFRVAVDQPRLFSGDVLVDLVPGVDPAEKNADDK